MQPHAAAIGKKWPAGMSTCCKGVRSKIFKNVLGAERSCSNPPERDVQALQPALVPPARALLLLGALLGASSAPGAVGALLGASSAPWPQQPCGVPDAAEVASAEAAALAEARAAQPRCVVEIDWHNHKTGGTTMRGIFKHLFNASAAARLGGVANMRARLDAFRARSPVPRAVRDARRTPQSSAGQYLCLCCLLLSSTNYRARAEGS